MNTQSNLRASDRTLILEVMDGEVAKTATGTHDPRLFTGEQNLKLKMDPESCLWYFQYTNNGLLPGGLKGRFTGAETALRHATNYFKTRNIKITAVRD